VPALLDIRAYDGSRHFAGLPESRSWNALRAHLARLPGAEVTGFSSDGVSEVWIDFSYEGESFTVNNQLGEYWFFVANARTSEAVLERVVEHCASLLGT
jgi:hypothetical protein